MLERTNMKTNKTCITAIAGIALLLAASGCQSDKDPSLTVIPGPGKPLAAADQIPTSPDNTPTRTQINLVESEPIDTEPIAKPTPDPSETDPDSKSSPSKGASNTPRVATEQELPTRIRFGDFWLDADALKSDTVYFAFDRSDIGTAELVKIEEVAVYLKTQTGNAVLVDGHCDDRGTEEYNRALGERRALTIRELLMSMGVAPDRIHTRSLGEDRPAETGQTEFAWSRNRRGEFALLVPVAPDS